MKLSAQMLAFLDEVTPSYQGWNERLQIQAANATRRWIPLVKELEAGAPSRSEVQTFARFLLWLVNISDTAETISVHVEREPDGTSSIEVEVGDHHIRCFVERSKKPSKEATPPNPNRGWSFWR